MKRHYVGLILLLVCAMGCQRDEEAAFTFTSLLQRKWHLVQTRKISSDTWHVSTSDTYNTVEYMPDGNLVYRRNDVPVDSECCSPITYTFRGITIQYKGQYICPNASCVTINDATISQLSETLLELTNGSRIYQYEAAK